MSWFDSILNLAALLLWLKWIDKGHDLPRRGISLIATLKKPAAPLSRGWFLLALLALLVIRSLLYWRLGSALRWTPKIWFGVIALPFRSDYFGRAALFSFFSFATALGLFYFCLIFFSVLGGQKREADPWQNLVRAQLGKIDALPALLKLFLPWLTFVLLWCLLNKPLVALGILPAPKAFTRVVEQGAIIGLGIYLVWKYLIVALLLLHLLNSYIYFGPGSFWKFIDQMARSILRLFSGIPLRFGKIDFAPVVAMVAVILVSEFAARGVLWIYQQLSI